MTWDNNKYVKLLIERREGKRDKYLIALKTTADFYGWTKKYPGWKPKTLKVVNGVHYCMDPGRKGEMFCEAGTRLRVCREPSRHGYPSTFTNAFKVSNNCSNFDISEIAHFTEGYWYWMSAPSGERITRERWEQIYQVGIQRQRVGA